MNIAVTQNTRNYEMITRWLMKNGYNITLAEVTDENENDLGWQCYYIVSIENRLGINHGKYLLGKNNEYFDNYGKATQYGMEFLLKKFESYFSR